MDKEAFFHFIGGAMGGTAGTAFTCPLEVIKTRLQSSNYQKSGNTEYNFCIIQPWPKSPNFQILQTNRQDGRFSCHVQRSFAKSGRCCPFKVSRIFTSLFHCFVVVLMIRWKGRVSSFDFLIWTKIHFDNCVDKWNILRNNWEILMSYLKLMIEWIEEFLIFWI